MADPTMNPFTPPRAELEGGVAADAGHRPAERGTRLVAALLDGLCALPMLVGIGLAAAGAKTNSSSLMAIGGVLAGLWLLGLGILQIYLLSTKGQTLGKRWMKIRIIKLDGASPGFVGAVLLRVFVNGLIGAVPYLGGIYGLVDILFIFREDRRCIHDLIAGTRVVMADGL